VWKQGGYYQLQSEKNDGLREKGRRKGLFRKVSVKYICIRKRNSSKKIEKTNNGEKREKGGKGSGVFRRILFY